MLPFLIVGNLGNNEWAFALNALNIYSDRIPVGVITKNEFVVLRNIANINIGNMSSYGAVTKSAMCEYLTCFYHISVLTFYSPIHSWCIIFHHIKVQLGL